MAPGRLDSMGSTIGVKISSTYLRAVKVPSRTTKDDRVSQEIAPHTVTPCEIAVCRLDNKCRIGPLAGAPPDTCAVVISTETESGFITEDDTSPVCHTPSCPRSAKIQSTLPMMWGQW
ncbi:hypothetical protein TNCV_1182691 [Trichonephila clavipes]|nr:hypothetical protein TNCV_1182691 [Trichonephila clavipes]